MALRMEMKLSMLSASVKPKNMELPGVGFDIGSENARMGFPLGDDRTLMSTSPAPNCTVCLEMLIMQLPSLNLFVSVYHSHQKPAI